MSAEVAVGLRGITTTFPGVVANDDVTLDFHTGEVHCLLGENGAGKTTLADVLSGMRVPDSGSVLVGGRAAAITRPRDSLDLGIGRVFQEPLLVPGLTVRENLLLTGVRRGAQGGWRVAAARAQSGLERVAAALGLSDDLDRLVEGLSLGRRQQVEILRAVRDATRLLILDEPTSLLAPPEVERLFGLLRQLTGEGLAVVFITHRLPEALRVATRISVLRRGRVVGTLGPERLLAGAPGAERDGVAGEAGGGVGRPAGAPDLEAELLTMMFGSGEVEPSATPPRGGPERRPRRLVLELERVSVTARRGETGLHDLSLGVGAGEIVGVAGLDGNGQVELAEVIAGQRRATSGDVRLAGESLTTLDVAARRTRGLGYVTADRVGEGSVGELSVALNAVLDRIGRPPFWRRGVVDRRRIAGFAQELVDALDIDLVSVEQPCRTLSGGNLQKLVLARELSEQPVAVVYREPTHGLDARTTRTVRRLIVDRAAGGAATLVVSTDLEELLEIADRIAVLRGGRLFGPVANRPGADAVVARLMSGEMTADAPPPAGASAMPGSSREDPPASPTPADGGR